MRVLIFMIILLVATSILGFAGEYGKAQIQQPNAMNSPAIPYNPVEVEHEYYQNVIEPRIQQMHNNLRFYELEQIIDQLRVEMNNRQTVPANGKEFYDVIYGRTPY
ncbi:MAG: hypothetical protein HQK92_02880 [Nitrospirae bacterium]|nr:hypothetical protein [Nitrospirota bacterium]